MASVGDYPLINDYSLCHQTVTIYHYESGEITRTVYPKAYFEKTVKAEVDERGESGKTEHLIVIPGSNIPCVPGDKVYLGNGASPEGDNARWWRVFIPPKDDKVVVVRSVSYRHWRGEVVHVELRG